MLFAFGLQSCDCLILEHFLLEQHDVGPFEDIQRDLLVVEVLGAEEALLVAGEDVLALLAEEAGPALQQVELAEDGLVLTVGQLCYVFQGDEHVLAHYRLLAQGHLCLRGGHCLNGPGGKL